MLYHYLSLSQSQGFSKSVTNPCYPAGYNRTLKLNSIFNSPCTTKYKPSYYNSQASLTVQGSGHYEHCLGNVSEIFSFDGCPYSQCSFDKVFQPNVTGSFMVSNAGGKDDTEGLYTLVFFFFLSEYFLSCVFRRSLHSSTFTPSCSESPASLWALHHSWRRQPNLCASWLSIK